MKKKYQKPSLEEIYFQDTDVIVTSEVGSEGDNTEDTD